MKEMIPYVDKDDNIIRIGERGSQKPNELHRASALWIWNHNGRALLAKRSKNKKVYPNMWGPAVAGTVRGNETYKETILREAGEEINIHKENLKLGPKIIVEDSPVPHFSQWFFLSLDKDSKNFKLQKEEVAKVRWFTKEEFIEEIKENKEGLHKRTLKFFDLF